MNARKRFAILLLGLLAPPLIVAQAEEGEKKGDKEVDTEFIFGFTAGRRRWRAWREGA
jgi:hypothetical protein